MDPPWGPGEPMWCTDEGRTYAAVVFDLWVAGGPRPGAIASGCVSRRETGGGAQ